MRTILDIPDSMYRKIKSRSALEGETVRSIALALFAQWLGEPVPQARAKEELPSDKLPDWFGIIPVDSSLPHDMESVRDSIARGMGGK